MFAIILRFFDPFNENFLSLNSYKFLKNYHGSVEQEYVIDPNLQN